MNKDLLHILRSALNHLYDYQYLQQSPLVDILHIDAHFEAGKYLNNFLMEEIEKLAQSASESDSAKLTLMYKILKCRYIQHFKQSEVAFQMGLSERQFRREQENALAILATSIWDYLNSDDRKSRNQPPGNFFSQSDMKWMRVPPEGETLDLTSIFAEVMEMTNNLTRDHHLTVTADLPDEKLKLLISRVLLKQILVNLIQIIWECTPKGAIHITFREKNHFMTSVLRFPNRSDPELTEIFRLTSRLLGINGGKLSSRIAGDLRYLISVIPTSTPVHVFLVDDNFEILTLFQRYAAGSRFVLHPTSDVNDIPERVNKENCSLVILDLMMPAIDGWRLLADIRQHPLTQGLPVLILSILPQETLALSLGAAGLLTKPVSQEQFLQALNEILADQAAESVELPERI